MYQFDNRIVMTLDAGGTNFVFSAMKANVEIVKSVCLPSNSDDLNKCLETLVEGFEKVKSLLSENPVAISFAFPGPADYKNGIIGDLPNLKAFRGGIALGPFLQDKFNVPVFINNDGNLFAYGESIAGLLPEINKKFQESGSEKRFKNILGLTVGTGFGAGFVMDGKLSIGDNFSGGDVWLFNHKKFPNCITEESVGVSAIQRMYTEFSNDAHSLLTPKDIFDIAEGEKVGNQQAALKTFAEMGEEAGNTIANAITLIDGLVVIGGGLIGAAKYFLPALLRELNGRISKLNGETFPRLQMKAYNLDDVNDLSKFIKDGSTLVNIPGTSKSVCYDSDKKIGVAISKFGASNSIALGAYAYALNYLDNQ